MADKELKKLKRRELLEMLLVQCEETERLQRELNETTAEYENLQEGYERLKKKLDIKDERLNQKDAKIAELKYLMNVKRIGRNTPESTKGSDHQELSEELGLTEEAEAAEQLAVPEERSISGTYQTVDRRTVRGQKIPYESGWRPVARRKKLHG